VLGCPARHGRAGQSRADEGLDRPRRGRDPAPGRVRPMPLTRRELPSGPKTPGVKLVPLAATPVAGTARRRPAAAGAPPLTPGVGPDGPASGHRAGPIAELLGGGSEHTRCPRHRLIGRAHWRPCPLAPPPWSSDAAAGSGRRWWPACPTPTTTRCVPMDMPANCQSVRHGTPRSTSQLPMRSRH
jgi:hypothetical protein